MVEHSRSHQTAMAPTASSRRCCVELDSGIGDARVSTSGRYGGSTMHGATSRDSDVANGNEKSPHRGHDIVSKRMGIDVTVVRELAALRAVESEWRALAGSGPSVLFRGPDWLIPWWLAYHNTLHGVLHVLVGRATEPDDKGANGTQVGDLVCLAPLYSRTVKVALLDSRELRMMGDAGPRPPSLDL